MDGSFGYFSLCSFIKVSNDLIVKYLSFNIFITPSLIPFWVLFRAFNQKDTRKGVILKIIIIFVPGKVLNMDNLPLNEYVKTKRKALGISREEFAQKAGVGLRFLRELEQGKETLKMDKVNQVLKLFGVQLGVVSMDRNNLIEQ